MVNRLYERTLHNLVANATVFKWNALEWGDAEVEQLATVLMLAASLEKLWINYNESVSDRAMIALAAVGKQGAMPRLQYLDLDQNGIGDEGLDALARALADGAWPKLKELAFVRGNRFRYESRSRLEAACRQRSITAVDGICTT